MLRQIFVFIKHFRANLARKCSFNDAVHAPLMSFEINLKHVCSSTVFYRALVGFFAAVNLFQEKMFHYYHSISTRVIFAT